VIGSARPRRAALDDELARAVRGAPPPDREPVRDLVGNDELEGSLGPDEQTIFREEPSGPVALTRQARLEREPARLAGGQSHDTEDDGVIAGGGI
jgi:hypothetical protein